MNDKRAIQVLAAVSQTELDVIRAYEHALRRIVDLDAREIISDIYHDHLRHYDSALRTIGELRAKVPEQSASLYGIFPDPTTTLKSMKSTREIFGALRLAQKVAVKTCSEAIKEPICEQAKDAIATILADEQQGLETVLAAMADAFVPSTETTSESEGGLFAA